MPLHHPRMNFTVTISPDGGKVYTDVDMGSQDKGVRLPWLVLRYYGLMSIGHGTMLRQESCILFCSYSTVRKILAALVAHPDIPTQFFQTSRFVGHFSKKITIKIYPDFFLHISIRTAIWIEICLYTKGFLKS